MPTDRRLRAEMYDIFEELRGAWRQAGVDYTDRIQLVRADLGMRPWQVQVTQANGLPAVTMPGFEDMTISPIRAAGILRAALQSARLVLAWKNGDARVPIPAHKIRPPEMPSRLSVVRDEP